MTCGYRGISFACLLTAVLTLSLAGCQSSSIPLFGKDDKPAEASAETAEAAPAEGEAATAAEGQAAPVAGETQADGQTTAAADTAEATGEGEKGGLVQSAGGQGSLAAAAGAADEPGPGVQRIDTKGGVGASLSRRLNKMLGRGNVATPSTGPQVSEDDVAGVWTLDEEDGLRVCTVTISTDDVKQVLRGPNCSGFVEGVASWSLFGPELQLRDEANTVLARLRQSGEGWVGFTVSTGVPLLLSRG